MATTPRRKRETHAQAALRRERDAREAVQAGQQLAANVIEGRRGIMALVSFSGDRLVLISCLAELIALAREAIYPEREFPHLLQLPKSQLSKR